MSFSIQDVLGQPSLKNLENEGKNSDWCSRVVKKMSEDFGCSCTQITKIFAAIFSNVSATTNTLKIICRSLLGIGHLSGKTIVPVLQSRFSETYNVLDTLQITDAINELVDIEDKNELVYSGSIAMLVAEITGLIIFFGEVSILALEQISATMGKIPVLGALAAIGLDTICTAAVGVGYLLFGIDSIVKLCRSDTSDIKKGKALVELTRSVIEVAFRTALLVVGGTVWVNVILGTFAASLGLCSFFYAEWMKQS